MPVLSNIPVVNAAIAAARDLPTLIVNLRRINPALADQLESKPLCFSRSPWGVLAAGLVGWISTRYGLGLDADTDALIAGAAVLAAGFLMRRFTNRPVAGLIATPAGTPPAVDVPPAA